MGSRRRGPRAVIHGAQEHSGSTPYASQVAGLAALHDRATKMGAEPEVIAETILTAATARRPKSRYAAPFSARVVIAASTLLPDRLLDAGTRGLMVLLRR